MEEETNHWRKCMKLAGKIVLVTGVDPFVGRGAARFLGSQGATVYLMERRRA
jgi:NAD(P)-dependent dehydrogenase (short-subunit alcohol dehydrogenase family)